LLPSDWRRRSAIPVHRIPLPQRRAVSAGIPRHRLSIGNILRSCHYLPPGSDSKSFEEPSTQNPPRKMSFHTLDPSSVLARRCESEKIRRLTLAGSLVYHHERDLCAVANAVVHSTSYMQHGRPSTVVCLHAPYTSYLHFWGPDMRLSKRSFAAPSREGLPQPCGLFRSTTTCNSK
jgi:hypothetical protein